MLISSFCAKGEIKSAIVIPKRMTMKVLDLENMQDKARVILLRKFKTFKATLEKNE